MESNMWMSRMTLILTVLLISFPATLEANGLKECPLRTLKGVEAQEMIVKGVIMHSEFEGVITEPSGYKKISFIHTVRADWTIWICLQALVMFDDKPQSLELLCTGCNYD